MVGFETEATSIYDTMKYIGNDIFTVGTGVAYGQAAMILSAGNKGKRFMTKHATAMQHRFFLVAPGDFVTTPKLAEAVAMGGAGGPIPVLVLPGGARDARAFPYSSWIDYCEVAFVVSARTATGTVTPKRSVM